MENFKKIVVDGMENTRDFHFPLRNNVKISKYTPILTFQITLSLQVNFHPALRQQRKKISDFSKNLKFFNSPQTLNLTIKLKFKKSEISKKKSEIFHFLNFEKTI